MGGRVGSEEKSEKKMKRANSPTRTKGDAKSEEKDKYEQKASSIEKRRMEGKNS